MADTAPEALRGLVLAGGRSRRFGRDKASEPFRGAPLLRHVLNALAPVVAEAWVSVRPGQEQDPLRRELRLIPDGFPTVGPAAGILSAHQVFPASPWLVVACDLPLISTAVLARLVAHRDARHAAVAYRSPVDGLPEPLCAIYEPATLSRFLRLVEAGGSPSPRDFLAGSDPVLLDAERPEDFVNINTPEDLRRLGEPGPPRIPG